MGRSPTGSSGRDDLNLFCAAEGTTVPGFEHGSMAGETHALLVFAASLVAALASVYLLALPLVRLAHLLGHAAVALAVAGGATVRLGERPRWSATVGDLSVSVASVSGTVGFCEPTGAIDGRRQLAFDLGGPVASLLLVLVTWLAFGLIAGGTLAYLVVWAVWWLSAAQFVLSVAPTVVPSWWSGPYAGATSDLHDHYPPAWLAGLGLS